MLRTPTTHIVEVGTNTKTPLIKKIHAGGPNSKANKNNNNKFYTKQQQANCKLYCDNDQHFYQTQYQLPATNKTKTKSTTTKTQQESLTTKSLLSSTPFSFMRMKKSKTTTKATKINNENNIVFCCDTKIPTNNTTTTTATTIPISTPTTPRTTLITLTNSQHLANISPTSVINNNKNKNNSNNNNNNNTSNNNNNNLSKNISNYLIKSRKTKKLSTTTTETTTLSSLVSSSSSSSLSSSSTITTTITVGVKKSVDVVAKVATATATTNTTTPSTTITPIKILSPKATIIPTSNITNTTTKSSMSPTSQTPSRTSLFDSCHRKIRLIGGGPVAFLGGLVAKARRKERDGDQNSTDTKLYLEESVLERKLPEADLKALVDLPAGLDYNEWLASHTLALFEHVNLVYGTISEFCTPPGCPDMTGPGNRTYLWFDEKGKKTRVAAPQYIDYVMTFTQKTVSDESIFPTKYANEFPSSFESIARKILRLQFHVIAHLYAAHFREIALLGLHTHLNLTFAHLTALHRRFNLIDEKETDVLRDLEVALRLTDDSQTDTDSVSNSSTSHCNNTTQHQQQQHQNLAHTTTNNQQTLNSSAGGCGGGNIGSREDVNLMHNATAAATGAGTGATIIDGDAAAPPICTQPEAAAKSTATAGVFGGGGGLIGGILGDLTSGEFGDTTRYCTSAVPSSSSCNSTEATTNSNNGGAGALHFNFTNNNNNHHHHHMHHHHNAHHQHHLLQQQHQHQHQHQQNSGLIQCNASNAPSSTTTSTTSTTA